MTCFCGKTNEVNELQFIAEPVGAMATVQPVVKERDTGAMYSRKKAVDLYLQIIQLYSTDKSLYIIDGCSGVGSCALACSTLGRKCIVKFWKDLQ